MLVSCSGETSEHVRVSLCLKNTFLEVPAPEDLRPLKLARSVTCPADLGVHPLEYVSTDASEKETEDGQDFSDSEDISAFTTTAAPPSPQLHLLPEEALFTTVMLRHIPNKYSQSDLLRALDSKGFRGRYDFFYLPADFRSQSNCGYAFINFVTPQDAADFSRVFRGFRLPALRSSKVCDVSWARIQGLASNVEHYRNNPINSLPDEYFKPLLFNSLGHRVPFPKPDRPAVACALLPPSVLLRGSRSPLGPSPGPTGPGGTSGGGHLPRPALPGGKIFIGGLSPDTTEAELCAYFRQFGEIAEVAIVADKKSGMSRGFGFCCFSETASVDKVLSVRQHIVLGQSVGVRRYARSSTNNVH